MLLDLASTPLSVRFQVGWSMSSWKSRSPRCSRLGTTTCVAGVAASSSSTAAIDMTLAVEPGSYASWRPRCRRAAGSASERSFGSKPGELAIARISPVLRVLHYHVPAVRLGLLHLLGDGVLRGPLDVAVDGQLDVGAGHGGRLGGARGRHLEAAGLGVADLAVLAGQLLVQLLLDAAAALAVGVDPAQYPGGEIAVRIHALAAGDREDAREDVDRARRRSRALAASVLFRSLICFQTWGVWRWASRM